jgi:SNF2 family DNA or RNA helicase
MFIYYLLCRDSIDVDIYEVLMQKQQSQSELIDQGSASREILERWSMRSNNNRRYRNGKKEKA